MIPLKREEQVVISNFKTEDDIEMSIDTNSSFIFEILREKIYSDLEGAVVREVCTNARDANREAGRGDVPIEISIGNQLVVKDCGLGMSPDRVRYVYSVYGASSKRSDNKQTGMFGLGSKTPFIVTDQFWVETIYEGVQYNYNIYIDETRKGKIKLVSQHETDKVGTTVKIPITNRYAFVQSVEKYMKYWEIQPKYIGFTPSIAPKPVLSGTNWKKYDFKGYGNGILLVDEIPYPSQYVPYGFTISLPNGVIEVAANRERIYENEHSKKIISEAVAEHDKEIVNKTQEKLDTLTELKDCVELISDVPAKLRKSVWKVLGHDINIYDTYKYIIRRRQGRFSQDVVTSEIPYADNYYQMDERPLETSEVRKLASFVRENGSVVIFFTGQLPFTFPDISAIPVVKRQKNSGPRQPKKPKSTIIAYDFNRGKNRRIKMDSEYFLTVDSMDYDGISTINEYGIVFVPERERPFVSHWKSLETYIKEEIDRITLDRLHEIDKSCKIAGSYDGYFYLKQEIPEFNILKLDYYERKRYNEFIECAQKMKMFKPKVHEDAMKALEKFPLLKHIAHYAPHNLVLDYVRLIKSTQKGDK